jgi:hypothetical protein
MFESHVSYPDHAHGAMWVAPIEGSFAYGSAFSLWVRRVSLWAAILIAVLVMAEL